MADAKTGYSTSETVDHHLSEYLAILRRRRKQVLHTAAAVFLASVVLAFVIPPVYRATATILIEQQDVPPDVVRSTTGYASQQIQVIRSRVLNHENLLGIAEKHKLFPEGPRTEAAEREVVGRMRRGIKIETVSANISDPLRGMSINATIAFNLSYDADTPAEAQKVTEELASLFLQENLRLRTQRAKRASGFLAEEEQRLRAHLDELEAKLAAYKERHTGRLPELMNMNMALLERTQKELEDIDRQIYNLEERKLQLQGQLSLVEPYSGTGPMARLKEAYMQYLSASALYSPDHPDVVRLRREVESIRRETGLMDEREALETEYKKVLKDLAVAQEKYAADHPDVIRLKTSLAALENKLKSAAASNPMGLALKPDNPAYIALQTQLQTVDLNLKAAHTQRARAKEKVAEYENRLVQTPWVEQEGLAMQREYDSALKKYREIKQSLMGAELAVELEKEEKGERFSILEPPQLPGEPRMPNRRAFLLLGLVLGLGSGVGVASIAEYMDRTIRGSRAISAVLRTSPLAVIPYIGDKNGQSGMAMNGSSA